MREAVQLVEQLSARIREMTVRPVVHTIPGDDEDAPPIKLTETKINELLRRCAELVAIDVEHPAHDGYPSTTPGNGSPGGGKGGGRLMEVPIDGVDGATDLVPTSSTESAALAPAPPRDPVNQAVVDVLSLLRKLAPTLELLDARLGALDRARLVSKVPDPPQCHVIGKVLGITRWDDEWNPTKWTVFKGLGPNRAPLFDEPVKVCTWVYWFAQHNKRLPTKSEAVKHLEAKARDRLAGRAVAR